MAGKGDKYRPVDREKYNTNFDRIFRGVESETPTATQIECTAIVKYAGAPWPIIKGPDLTKMDHPTACKYLVEGMKVKVVCKEPDYFCGWDNTRIAKYMDEYVGKVFTIEHIEKFGVRFSENARYNFPAFCLQIIEQENKE